MYDAPKVLAGLAIFIALATLPFWIDFGSTEPLPKAVVMDSSAQCVESADWMRANHMQLLDNWRHEVVRDGERTYVNSQGKTFEKSLTKTCLDCHSNSEQFCDECHKAVSVEPYCFTCHLVPGDFAATGPEGREKATAHGGPDDTNAAALAMLKEQARRSATVNPVAAEAGATHTGGAK